MEPNQLLKHEAEMVQAFRDGMSRDAVAAKFGIGVWVVDRALRAALTQIIGKVQYITEEAET